MAPLGSSCSHEEDFGGNAPDMNCMICRRSYEESPEMVITNIMTQTYCKICIREKLQSEQAHDQFIRGVPTGQRRNNENTVILETSSAVTSLPRGYVYPNSKIMKMAVDQGRPSANKKVPYSSLRMNPENSGIRKRKRAMR